MLQCKPEAAIAEIIVVHGRSGAGKSTQCERLARTEFRGVPVGHVPVGNMLRAIRKQAAGRDQSEVTIGRDGYPILPDEVINEKVFEAVRDFPRRSIVLLDSYPRYYRSVDMFLETLRAERHNFLGVITLDISMSASNRRVEARGFREGEEPFDESRAIFKYNQNMSTTGMAIRTLISRYEGSSWEEIDASGSEEEVSERFKRAIGELALGHIVFDPEWQQTCLQLEHQSH